MKQKICALAVTAALSISLFTTPAFAAETSFTDVSGHWAEEAVSAVVEKGLFNGTSEDTFSPDVSMNRGMFVTVLGRFAEGMGFEVSGTSAFEDVPADAYFARYVAWGAENGIVNGVSETSFAPDADVTREQMCALFVRFLEFVKYELPEIGELTFADTAKISSWAVDPVKTAVALGLIQGVQTSDGTVFNPADSATRAQVAAVFLRLDGLEGIYDLKPAAPAEPTTPAEPVTPEPTEPTTPANPIGGGGGGGGEAPSQPTQPSQPAKEYTEAEKAKEAEIAGYLKDMLNMYDGFDMSDKSKVVRDTFRTLMETLRSALKARDNGAFLSKEYVQENYADTIAEVKAAYYGMSSEDSLEFETTAMGMSSHVIAILNYFGVKR